MMASTMDQMMASMRDQMMAMLMEFPQDLAVYLAQRKVLGRIQAFGQCLCDAQSIRQTARVFLAQLLLFRHRAQNMHRCWWREIQNQLCFELVDPQDYAA
jgi:hypothetical protein